MLGFDPLGSPPLPLEVQFRIVLPVLLRISTLVAPWAIGKGTTPRSAWTLPAAVTGPGDAGVRADRDDR